jgi:hypothetical protein
MTRLGFLIRKNMNSNLILLVRTLQGATKVMLPFPHSLSNHKQKAFMQNITVHQLTVYDHQRKRSDWNGNDQKQCGVKISGNVDTA